MQAKKLKQLKKLHAIKKEPKRNNYIDRINSYLALYNDIFPIKLLLTHVLNANYNLENKLEPKPLPKLLLPDNIQDTIYEYVNSKFGKKDVRGDKLWDQLTSPLANLDRDLRNFRDFISSTYGMWAYTHNMFLTDLSEYLNDEPILEIMAGNGYISAGLIKRNSKQTVFTTDDTSWTKENKTGTNQVTRIEKLDALSAIDKYANQIAYVIMSWSPDGIDIDWQIYQKLANEYPNVKLLVIGEKYGATNSKIFWDNTNLKLVTPLNVHYESFDLINEKVFIAEFNK